MKGIRTPVRTGLIIGRRQGDLNVRDSKVSSKHAAVEKRPDDHFWLVDLGSSNGIKTENGRVLELKLEGGVKFTLGRTLFQIVSVQEAAVDADVPTAVMAVTVTRTFWDTVLDLTKKAMSDAKVVKKEIAAFDPPLKLRFTKGVQVGTEWTIGYGPRLIGANSVDLAIEEAEAPALCFKLIPQHQGVLFKNESEKDVKLNGKWVESEFLRHGDVIEVRNTQIQVDLG